MLSLFLGPLFLMPCCQCKTLIIHRNTKVLHMVTIAACIIHTYHYTKVVKIGQQIPWMNCEIKVMMKKRRKLYDKARRTNNPDDWSAYKSVKNAIIKNSKCLTQHINRIAKTCLTQSHQVANCKCFWSSIERKRKTPNISSLKVNDNFVRSK